MSTKSLGQLHLRVGDSTSSSDSDSLSGEGDGEADSSDPGLTEEQRDSCREETGDSSGVDNVDELDE